MTENTVEDQVVNSDVLPVASEFVKWRELSPDATVEQTLHPALLNQYDKKIWEKHHVAKQIARWILSNSPTEARNWYDDRTKLNILEQGKYYKRVRGVTYEMGKLINPKQEK
jgi:hypothetical protein